MTDHDKTHVIFVGLDQVAAEFEPFSQGQFGITICPALDKLEFHGPRRFLVIDGQISEEYAPVQSIAQNHGAKVIVCYRSPPKMASQLLVNMGDIHALISLDQTAWPLHMQVAISAKSTALKALDPILTPSENPFITPMKDSSQRTDLLNLLYEKLGQTSAFPDFKFIFATSCWELAMNAFYSAPIDPKTGARLFAATPRDQEVTWPDPHFMTTQLDVHAKSVSFSVLDPFGSLSKSDLLGSFSRAFQDGEVKIKTGYTGAGVGLTMVIHSVHLLIFQVSPGMFTKVTIQADLCKRHKEYGRSGPSVLFLFQ